MKKEDLIHAMNDIQDDYIEEANPFADTESPEFSASDKRISYSDLPPKKRRFRRSTLGGILAACFAGAVAFSFLSQTALRNSTAVKTADTDVAETTDYSYEDTYEINENAYADYEDSAAMEESDYASYSTGISESVDSSYENSEETESSAAADETDGTISAEKLVYTAYLTIQTKEYTTSRDAIRKQIQQLGGFIESESETDSNDSWYYYDYDSDSTGYLNWDITIRIPTENYETFMASVDDAGKVLSRSSNVTNITKQYSDTQIKIQTLESQLDTLQDMMEKAESIEDMITIERRISDVTYELNSCRSSLSDMDTDVAYSTIHLTLEEVVSYKKPETPKSTFGDRLLTTILDSADMFLEGLESLLFFVIYLLPYAIVILIVVLVIRAIIRRRKKS